MRRIGVKLQLWHFIVAVIFAESHRYPVAVRLCAVESVMSGAGMPGLRVPSPLELPVTV